MPSETDLDIDLKDNMTAQDIIDLGNFLKEVQNLTIPAKRYYESFARELNNARFLEGNINANYVASFFAKLKQLVDDHNLYFESLSAFRLSKVVNNSTMNGTYNVSRDPVNLMQAHTSVDATTGPLKKKANTSSEAAEADSRTPGNEVNKFEGINENQVGKKGISICATGLKSYFGLTQYCNYILNNGTTEEQERLLLGGDHKGIHLESINKTYKTLANIRALDLNTVRNSELFSALSEVTQDEDVALTLSALLSLATDNAKELALSKLNAGTKMLGMYVYGLSIGMEFNDIADILMSPVGNVIKNMLDDDKFAERDAFNTVNEGLFKYFIDGPFRQLQKFNISSDSQGNILAQSPTDALEKHLSNVLKLTNKSGKPQQLSKSLVDLAKMGISLKEKFSILEELRNKYAGQVRNDIQKSKEAIEIYNQLIDFVEDYIQQSDVIWKNQKVFNDIAELSAGAQEMKTLGQILSLNQGIKTTSSDFITQINNLRRAIYDKTNNLEDLVDLTKFAFDDSPYIKDEIKYSSYREYIISRYENLKTAFNIFDVVTKVPHFMGYLQTLVTTNVEVNNAFTFRSSDNLLLDIKLKLGGYIKEDNLMRGIQNFCGDYLLKRWMLDTENQRKQIIVPKGNQAFDKAGNLYTLTEDKILHLGLDEDNATFRLWMENEVIPNLKNGVIKPGTNWTRVSNNKFIKDLGNNLLNKTVSKNSTIVQSLPINMLPSTDAERNMFNQYKSQFNDLTVGYQSQLTRYITNPDETVQEETYLSDPIAVTDLFIYYAMIANSWKLDQASLVPITEDFQNTGIIKSFHDYVAEIDKSEFTLSLDNIIWEELLPYVAPSSSPYSSTSEYIWAKDPQTQKRMLMRKQTNNDENEEAIGTKVGKYNIVPSVNNINFFGTNQVSSGKGHLKFDIKVDNAINQIAISYDLVSGVYNVNNDKANVELHEQFKDLPIIKTNQAKIPDMQLLQVCLEHILNKC